MGILKRFSGQFSIRASKKGSRHVTPSVMLLEDRLVPANALNTLDVKGINADGLGLTGQGVKIGQVEGASAVFT